MFRLIHLFTDSLKDPNEECIIFVSLHASSPALFQHAMDHKIFNMLAKVMNHTFIIVIQNISKENARGPSHCFEDF